MEAQEEMDQKNAVLRLRWPRILQPWARFVRVHGDGSIPIDTFLVGWTSIYQLFWGSLGTRVLTHPHISTAIVWCPMYCPLRFWPIQAEKQEHGTASPPCAHKGTLFLRHAACKAAKQSSSLSFGLVHTSTADLYSACYSYWVQNLLIFFGCSVCGTFPCDLLHFGAKHLSFAAYWLHLGAKIEQYLQHFGSWILAKLSSISEPAFTEYELHHVCRRLKSLISMVFVAFGDNNLQMVFAVETRNLFSLVCSCFFMFVPCW